MTPTHVLIAKDRPDIAARLRDAVDEADGVTLVSHAATIDQWVNMLFDLRPRVVLVEIGLPKGAGIDVVRACAYAV